MALSITTATATMRPQVLPQNSAAAARTMPTPSAMWAIPNTL